MATTTNYGWTTPDDTALVKDGASAIRTLGSSVDTSVKALNPGTTAGDLDYYTAATTKSRIAIGTNGQVLTSNGSVPSWATPSSGGMTLLSTTTLGSTQTTISSISQSYNQLLFICTGFTWSTGSTYPIIYPNSVTASVFTTGIRYDSTNAPASAGIYSEIVPFRDVSAVSTANNTFYILISNYTSTAYKPLQFFGNTATANATMNQTGASRHTAAISSMQFTTQAGTATIGGTVLTYGVK